MFDLIITKNSAKAAKSQYNDIMLILLMPITIRNASALLSNYLNQTY